MTPDITLKQNDSGRILTGQFTDANGEVNCSGNTGRKIMMRKFGTATLKINSTFTFTDEAAGRWAYTLQAADVDTIGRYLLEFEVTFPTQVVSFPVNRDNPYMVVLIQDDLG